jgi:hypothetical protein
MLEINGGIWSPLLQMLVNALLHLAGLLLLLRLLLAGTSGWRKTTLLLAAALLACLPLASDNTLNSFQSQVYFLLLLSFAFIHGLCTQPALAPRWWLALACGGLACLASAGGALTLATGALLLLARARHAGSPPARRWLLPGAMTVFAVIAVVTTPATPPIVGLSMDHGQMHAARLLP